MRAQIVFRNTPPRAVILIFMGSDSAGQSTQSQQEVFSQGGAVCSKKQKNKPFDCHGYRGSGLEKL